MKILSILFISFLFAFSSLQAQDTPVKKTVEGKFWAAGVCGMCQNRIETALDVPGVKFASWDKESQIVRVIYRQDKISLKELKAKVASVGHKTEDVPKDKKAYENLPMCCQYEDGKKKH